MALIFVAALAAVWRSQQSPDKKMLVALQHEEYEEVKAAIDAGANPNAVVQSASHLVPPEPALAYAMRLSGPRAYYLVEKGADVNAVTGDNAPVLIQAIENQDVKLVALMLSKGADPNCYYRVNPRGYILSGTKNALMTAIELKNLDIVKLLLQKGANPNYKLRSGLSEFSIGSTVLIWAVGINSPAVKLLLEAGADPTVKDEHGRTALDAARQLKRVQTVKELMQWQNKKP